MQIEWTKEHYQMEIKAGCNPPQNVRQYLHDPHPQLSSSFANPLPSLKPLPAPQTQPAVRFWRGGAGSWGSVLPPGCSRADRILQYETHGGSGSQPANRHQPPGGSQPAARHESSNHNKSSRSHGTSHHAPCHPRRPDCYHLHQRFFKQQQRLECGFHGRVRVKLQFVGLL